jgi:hypothetical protein
MDESFQAHCFAYALQSPYRKLMVPIPMTLNEAVDKVVTFEALCSVSANLHINLTDRSGKNANLPCNDRHIKSKTSLCTDHRNGLVSVQYPREDGFAFI